MAANVLNIPLRVVFYQEDEDWVAHCLEFDLLGHGPTPPDALNSLSESVRLQVEYSLERGAPENLFSPADPKYFLMFAAGEVVAMGEMTLDLKSIVIDKAETRQYRGKPADAQALLPV